MNRALIFTALTLLLSACSMEPRYRRPCMEMPPTWRVESDESSTLANLRWWESLGDPILDALIETALANNKDLQVAIWRVCEYAAKYQVDSSLLYPQLNLQGSVLKELFPVQPTFLPPGFDPITPDYKFAFNLSYELDFWGRIRSISHAAYAELLASVENRRTVVLTLVASVANTYIDLRELDKELEISYKTLEERRQYLEYAKLRFEGGLTSEIEVTQAASVYDETAAVINVLNTQIPQKENYLSILLGENPTCILRGREVDEFSLPPEIPTGLPSDLLQRRPDIVESELLLIAANARIGAARAAFFPDISLTGLFGKESFALKSLFTAPSTAWHYGTNFLQPLFTGGRLTGLLKLAWAQKEELVFKYEQTILNAFKEVDDALIGHEQSRKLVVIEQDRVNAITEYLYLAWLRYYNGQTDYLTVLDAERQLFASQISLAKAQSSVFTTLVDIYKALGGGWVVDADCCLRP